MRRPVDSPYVITTEFGVPDSYAKFGKHSGVDYAVPTGRPVYAPASGNLTQVVSPTGGNMVVIFEGRFYHRLMHNNSFSRGNGPVSEGQEVAKAGTTGLSTGSHCHWDINTEGTYPTSFAAFINPADWLAGKYVNQGGSMSVTDLGIARVLAHGVLGRNQSPNNALAGECDADLNKNHVGKETNAKIWEFYNSAEGKAWRDQRYPATLAENATLKKNLSEVTADRDGLIKKLEASNAAHAAEVQKINESYQDQIVELGKTIEAQQKTIAEQALKIAELEKQLSESECKPLTDYTFGELLGAIINKLTGGKK